MSNQALEDKLDKVQNGLRIFTEAQFKQANRLEKIEMHLIQPSLPLNNRDTQYLFRLEAAFMISKKSLSILESIKKLRKLYNGLNYQNAAKLIHDAEDLFGPVIKRKKEMSLAVLSYRTDEVYKKALKAKNLKQANESIRLGILIEAQRKEEESENFWERLQPPNINFTTDARALHNAEFLEHEELNEGVDESE